MSNKSLFNRTLIKKDLKILAPIFVINIVLLIFALPFSYSQATLWIKSTSSSDFTRGVNIFYNQYNTSLINIVVATITPIILYSTEKANKSMELLISLPFSRKQIFFNKMAVGFIVNIVPSIIMYALSFVIVVSEPMSKPFFNTDMFMITFLNTVATQMAVFSYFAVIGMLFGNIFATAFCGFVFTLIPVGLVVMVEVFLSDNVSLASYEILYNFTPFFIFLKSLILPYGYLKLFGYSVIFIIIAMALFEMTKMEKISELLTFKKTEKFFRAGVTICSAMFFAIFVQAIFMSFGPLSIFSKIIGFIVGGGFGYFIPKRAINKSRAA